MANKMGIEDKFESVRAKIEEYNDLMYTMEQADEAVEQIQTGSTALAMLENLVDENLDDDDIVDVIKYIKYKTSQKAVSLKNEVEKLVK